MAVGFNIPNGAFRLNAQEAGGGPSYIDALMKGFQGAQSAAETVAKPKGLAESLLQAQLRNAHDRIVNQYLPRSEEARIGHTEAQTGLIPYQQKLYEAQANMASNPLTRLSGAAHDAYSLELLKTSLGADSPAYQAAKSQYELDQDSARGLNTYRQGLTDTMNKRSASNLGKMSQEELDITDGYEPNTGRQHQISPERQDELLGQYQLAKQKAFTDSDTRKKVLFAKNIDTTINSINKRDLNRYAGLKGVADLKTEEIKAATSPGTESENYRKYLENANKAQLLAKQVRQFYGDSIQPSMLDKIEKLASPATWKNNPEIASRLFDSFTQLLKQETGTYTGALKSTQPFAQSSNQPKTRKYNLATGSFE